MMGGVGGERGFMAWLILDKKHISHYDYLLCITMTYFSHSFFVLISSVLEKDHPTGSKICCCIPRFRTPVCVLSVLVKSAVDLQKRSLLLSKHSILLRSVSVWNSRVVGDGGVQAKDAFVLL